MRTIAILPIKSFGAAKQRLALTLGGGSREALAQAMFSDVLAALRHTPGIDAIAVVTANRDAESVVARWGAVVLADHHEDGQSAAAQIGVRYALEHGYGRALLVPGDTPLLDPVEIADLLERAEADETGVVIVPDRHETGTNALLLCPPNAIEPSFGEGSCGRHTVAATESGHDFRVKEVRSLALDVDTPGDLSTLEDRLGNRRGQAPLTEGALRQLDRSQARAAAVSKRVATSRIHL